MIKLLIFDFDGTLADTKKLYYNSIHHWLNKYGFKFSKKEFKEYSGIKLRDIIFELGIHENVKKIKLQVHRDIELSSGKIKITSDLGEIKKLSIKKIIASNTITSNILKILKKKGINIFSEVYGGDKFPSKAEFIKRYIKKNKLKRNEVLYIGDMVKDIEVARKAQVQVVSISHNFSWDSKKKLLEAKPDYIISTFRDLRKIL